MLNEQPPAWKTTSELAEHIMNRMTNTGIGAAEFSQVRANPHQIAQWARTRARTISQTKYLSNRSLAASTQKSYKSKEKRFFAYLHGTGWFWRHGLHEQVFHDLLGALQGCDLTCMILSIVLLHECKIMVEWTVLRKFSLVCNV